MQTLASQMVTDLAELSNQHSGILYELAQVAEKLGLDLKLEYEPEFEILFPRHRPEEDWRFVQQRQSQAIARLTESWAKQDPVTVLRLVEKLRGDASSAGIDGASQLYAAFQTLAQSIESPIVWIRAMLEVGTRGSLADGFLRKAAGENSSDWPDVAKVALERPDWSGVVAYAVLMTPSPPSELLSSVFSRLEGDSQIVYAACICNEVPETTLFRLLQDGDEALAGAAAVGEWHAKPERRIRESLREVWRPAVLRCPAEQNGIGEVLKTDSALALDWLLAHFDSSLRRSIDSKHTVHEALSALDSVGRHTVLSLLPPNGFDPRVISRVIGDDLDVYRDFLSTPRPADQHLAPLGVYSRMVGFESPPDMGNTWVDKAVLALDQRYTPDDVAAAAIRGRMAYSGNESEMWDAWIGRFETIRGHADSRIRQVAEIGRDRAISSRDVALRRERVKAVFGYD